MLMLQCPLGYEERRAPFEGHLPLPLSEVRGAEFSACRKYRYTLWRHWGDLFSEGYAMFIGLNPSTADETIDDPTIRRCIGFARDWRYGGLCMTNIFAFGATSPEVMKTAKDPIGPENDRFLLDRAKNASVIIAAWGVHGSHLRRDEEVKKLIPRLSVLKLTKNGHPAHPLYLRRDLQPIPWTQQQCPAAAGSPRLGCTRRGGWEGRQRGQLKE